MPRRFSRGTPHNVLLTVEQQEAFLALLKNDDGFREGVETLIGVKNILKKPKQEQLAAVRKYVLGGEYKALLSQIAGAGREFDAEVALKKGEISAQDRIALLEAERDTLKERLGEKPATKRAVRDKAVKG